jgi:glycosyltransferase involved in cell wall biosynthesis
LGTASDNALISLVLACYNQEKFVGEAVEGVLSQTYSPLEIVIVDDCSPDATASVIEAKLAEHPERRDVRFIRNKKNLKPGGVSQLGLSVTKADFITIASGDDILLPEMIAEIAEVWREGSASLVITNATYIDDNSNLLHRTYRDPNVPADDSFETILRDGVNACCFGPSMSFERQLYVEFGWPPGHLECADIIYPFYSYLLKGGRFLSKPLFKYRVHAANTSISLMAERQTDEMEKLLVEDRDFRLRLNHAVFMDEEMDRLRVEKRERYWNLAEWARPLIAVQIAETAKKLVRVGRRMSEVRSGIPSRSAGQ